MNAKKLAIIAATVIAAFLPLSSGLHAQTQKTSRGDIILGAKAGYSMFEGYYRSRFLGSYCVGASIMYGNPAILKFLMGEFEVTYARYPLKESRKSYMENVAANVGPVVYYQIVPHFQIYAGASALGSYLHLYTDLTDKNEKTFKPGLLARAGLFFPIKEGVRIRAGVEYTLVYLSGKPLHGVNFIGGLSYNFNPDEELGEVGSIQDPSFRVEFYLSRAEIAIQKGNVEDAKDYYNRILALDRNHREAREQLDRIKMAEADFARAVKLIADKRFYDALPLLDDAGKFMASAREEQGKIRKQLAGEAPALEKKGVELYEKGDYRGCIGVMKQLLLIDPRNKVGGIYLPRALKRQEALERLR